jgi:hypothetical protein
MSEFSKELANQFYCSTIDFVEESTLEPSIKFRLVLSLLESIDFWLLYALAREVKETTTDKEVLNGVLSLQAHLKGDKTITIGSGAAELKITNETLLFLLIRNNKREVKKILKTTGAALLVKPSDQHLFDFLTETGETFLRGDREMFRTAMSLWCRTASFYKKCKNDALAGYIQSICQRSLEKIALDKKPSRNGFASNSDTMESLTKAFERKDTSGNNTSVRLIKFLKSLSLPADSFEQIHSGQGSATSSGSVPNNADENMYNVIFYGPPGTGKTRLASEENQGCKRTDIQFHPSYAYENFVQGEKLVSIGDQRFVQVADGPIMTAFRHATNSAVRTKARVIKEKDSGFSLVLPVGFLQGLDLGKAEVVQVGATMDDPNFIDCAVRSADTLKFNVNSTWAMQDGIIEVAVRGQSWSLKQPQVIFIDEINRADVARVFGELLKAISDRDNQSQHSKVSLQYSGEKFFWPSNMRIIGTMNCADRSIGEMDQALKRRFRFHEVKPDPDVLSSPIKSKEIEHLFKIIKHHGEQQNYSSAVKQLLKQPKFSCDDVIAIYNEIGLAHRLATKEFKYVNRPSKSLGSLHDTILAQKDAIIRVRHKLIGHSFHISFCQDVSKIIALHIQQGAFDSRAGAIECSQELLKRFNAMTDQEILPQIESMCMGNEALFDKIVGKWKDADSEAFADLAAANPLQPTGST